MLLAVRPDRCVVLSDDPKARVGCTLEEVSDEAYTAIKEAGTATFHDGGVFLSPDHSDVTIGPPSAAWLAGRRAQAEALAAHEADVQHLALHPDTHVQAMARLLGINREEVV